MTPEKEHEHRFYAFDGNYWGCSICGASRTGKSGAIEPRGKLGIAIGTKGGSAHATDLLKRILEFLVRGRGNRQELIQAIERYLKGES